MTQVIASTMQDGPLSIGEILQHGATVFRHSKIVTWDPTGPRSASFDQVADRVARLANALKSLGVERGDRVATFLWNVEEHFVAYLAVPSMGAVLHTVNLRLPREQLEYVFNHGGAKVVIVDAALAATVAALAPRLDHVKHLVLVGPASAGSQDPQLPASVTGHSFDQLLDGATSNFPWPAIDERSAAAMCYTSGTTGNPKGVVYSHRSIYLHSMSAASGNVFGLSEQDRILPIVPMFHANAWGLPYAGWMAGTDFVLPGPHLQPASITAMIEQLRPTVASAVPTIWNELLAYVDRHPADLSSLRLVPCGGSSVPASLMQRFEAAHGVPIVQAWGMTETSPVASFALMPARRPESEKWQWRSHSGRIVMGVRLRIVDDAERELPWDGESVGELQVKGPWVTASYYQEANTESFSDGWLRTGDVATVLPNGYLQITDRRKDIIKSGGEWISSVNLENLLMAHPDVYEAALIAIPDAQWDERPLAVVVPSPGAVITAESLRAHLLAKLPRWQVPEHWTFADDLPKTSTGKFDKKVLRQQHAVGALTVTTVGKEDRTAP
jgi:fatty-acyl-CoA synthase